MAVKIMSEEKIDSIAVTVGTTEEKTNLVENADTNADENETHNVGASDKTSSIENSDLGKQEEADVSNEDITEDKYKNWPLRDIKEPHENDVLYGRGGGTNHHPGNKRYRKMVEKRKMEYINSKRLDKPNVAIKIIDEWRSQDPPGRFLKQDEATGLWNDVGPKKAREKTSQALREKAPQLKQDNKKKTAYIENNREVFSEPENFYNDQSNRQRMVSFPQEDSRSNVQPSRKISRAVLMRDHSLGRDVVKSGDELNLDGFSWQKPAGAFIFGDKNRNHGLGRQNSLAMNPLTQTNVAEPARRDYFSKDDSDFHQFQRRSSGSSSHRRNSSSRKNLYNEERRSSFRRSSSSENLSYNADYQTNIYQSWSHGQEDEYLQQNNHSYPSWDKPSFEPLQRSKSGMSASSNNSYSNYPGNHQPYSGEMRGSPIGSNYYPPYGISPNRRTSDASTSSNQMLPPAPVPIRSGSNSSRNYVRERSSPPNYRGPYQQYAHPGTTHQSYSSQNSRIFPPQSVSQKGNFDDIFDRSKQKHQPDPVYPSISPNSRKTRRPSDRTPLSTTRLDRPSTVKRATSNQNEEAATKKETKLIKRPGLNREHSITAYNLKIAQREKEMNTRNAESIGITRKERIHRHHSLAANKLDIDEHFLEEPISKTIFSTDDNDKNDDLEPLQTKIDPFAFSEPEIKKDVLEDDLQHIERRASEIDLGQTTSPSLERPSTISLKNRMSTMEMIDQIVASSGDDIFENIIE